MRLTVVATYPDAETLQAMLESGMEAGAAETYDRLEAYAPTLA